MSDKNRPPCLFCNQTTAATTDEHVLPHSWKKTFPSGDGGQVQIGRNRDGRNRVPREKKQVSPYDLRVKKVCKDCNGGWMRLMDEAIKNLIFDLSWGRLDHISGDEVEQLSTWCTKVALLRTHLDRGREQESPLELTHRFYAEHKALGANTVQIARVLNSDSSLSGNICRELRGPTNFSIDLGERLDAVHLVTFQIGQLFFQVGLSTSSDWSKVEVRRLLAAGRRNRADRVHILRAGQDIHLENGLAQAEVLELIDTCRVVSQVSAQRESRLLSEAMRGTVRGRGV